MRKIKQNVRPERVLPLDNRHIGATRVKAFREHGQKSQILGLFIILAVRHLNYI